MATGGGVNVCIKKFRGGQKSPPGHCGAIKS